jgi:hypothetical protein
MGRTGIDGLTVGASNGEVEGHEQRPWTLGLYSNGEQLAYLSSGTLADQITVASLLTVEQIRALKSRSSVERHWG